MSTSQTNHPAIGPVNDPEVASVLTCWKDIAQYVGKGVRTLQRWERELGFPVRRTKPGEKGSVLAIPREIDAWVKSQQLTTAQQDSALSDRATLLRSLDVLRTENEELRLENRKIWSENLELRRQLANRPISRRPGLATMGRDVLLKG
jgi:hypothetical protein